jgi:serine protease inhibitor
VEHRIDPSARFGNTAIGSQREAMIMIVPSHAPSGEGAVAIALACAALACQDETAGSSNGDVLEIANSMWLQTGLHLQPTFVSTLKDGYGATPAQTDFSGAPADATRAINTWASQ